MLERKPAKSGGVKRQRREERGLLMKMERGGP
jgi:hypothetical protein